MSLLRIGLPLTASTLLQIGRYRVFAILIGGTAGPTALGQIHVAFRLVDTVRDITFTAMWRLLLPILSEHQHDAAAMRREVDRLLYLSSAVTMPLCGGLAVTLVPVTRLILGPAWQAAGAAAEPLVGLMALLALMFPSGAALIAVGQARYTLYANIAGLVATVGFVLCCARKRHGRRCWCGPACRCSSARTDLWVNARALGTGLPRPLRAGVPALLVSVAGVVAALAADGGEPVEALIRRIVVFGVVVMACGLPLLWLRRAAWIPGTGPPATAETARVPRRLLPWPRLRSRSS